MTKRRTAKPAARSFGVHRLGPRGLRAQLRAGYTERPQSDHEVDFITPQYAVVYIAQGAGWYADAAHRRFTLAPGMFYQRFPNRPHTIHIDGPVARFHIAMPSQTFELMRLTLLIDTEQPVHEIGLDMALVDRAKNICAELESQAERKLMVTLLAMQQLVIDMHLRTRSPARAPTSGHIARACELLRQDLGKTVRIPAVARKVGMSNSAFRKTFTRQIGIPPGEFRIRRKVERAMQLISEGRLRFNEIALRLGYSDAYAFSAQFKKFTGLSPRRFQAQSR